MITLRHGKKAIAAGPVRAAKTGVYQAGVGAENDHYKTEHQRCQSECIAGFAHGSAHLGEFQQTLEVIQQVFARLAGTVM